MNFLAAMLAALPRLKRVRLGIYEETLAGKASWSAEQVEVARAALPAGCVMGDPGGLTWRMEMVDGFGDYVELARNLS
jgi:hypothetical protein